MPQMRNPPDREWLRKGLHPQCGVHAFANGIIIDTLMFANSNIPREKFSGADATRDLQRSVEAFNAVSPLLPLDGRS
jgi:hypothetical protein